MIGWKMMKIELCKIRLIVDGREAMLLSKKCVINQDLYSVMLTNWFPQLSK